MFLFWVDYIIDQTFIIRFSLFLTATSSLLFLSLLVVASLIQFGMLKLQMLGKRALSSIRFPATSNLTYINSLYLVRTSSYPLFLLLCIGGFLVLKFCNEVSQFFLLLQCYLQAVVKDAVF